MQKKYPTASKEELAKRYRKFTKEFPGAPKEFKEFKEKVGAPAWGAFLAASGIGKKKPGVGATKECLDCGKTGIPEDASFCPSCGKTNLTLVI